MRRRTVRRRRCRCGRTADAKHARERGPAKVPSPNFPRKATQFTFLGYLDSGDQDSHREETTTEGSSRVQSTYVSKPALGDDNEDEYIRGVGWH